MARRKKKFTKRVEEPSFRINKAIRVPEIRLVGDNFDELSEAAGYEVSPGVFKTIKTTKMETSYN